MFKITVNKKPALSRFHSYDNLPKKSNTLFQQLNFTLLNDYKLMLPKYDVSNSGFTGLKTYAAEKWAL
jgi:hypothetical protein